MGPAIGLVLASYAGCNRALTVFWFTVGMAFMGFYYPSIKVNTLDLAPNYAGTLMAIVNGLGAVSGIFSPSLVGLMVPDSTMTQWRLVFWVTFFILAITNLFYLVFGSADIQPWNDIQPPESPDAPESPDSPPKSPSRTPPPPTPTKDVAAVMD
ncbi:hypothetical protein WDU94_006752 [Cyamophila willieti]